MAERIPYCRSTLLSGSEWVRVHLCARRLTAAALGRRLRVIVVCIAGLAFASPALSQPREPLPDIETIRNAWTKRERQVNSLICQWTADVIIGAESQSWHEHGDVNRRIPFPPEDVVVQHERKLSIVGDTKMRYEYKGPQIITTKRTIEPRWYLSVTDGTDRRGFYDKDQQRATPSFPPRGFISTGAALPEMYSSALEPLSATFRPNHPWTQDLFDISSAEIKGVSTVADRPCIHLERVDPRRRRAFWLDLERDFLLVRRTSSVFGQSGWWTSYEIDIEYEYRASDEMWIPAAWQSASWREDGKIATHSTATVTSVEINPPIAESTFRFDFPVGTLIVDRDGDYYLLRAGGEKRMITRAEQEARVPYETLLVTGEGEGMDIEGGHGVARYLILAASLAAIVVLVWWMRWRQPA